MSRLCSVHLSSTLAFENFTVHRASRSFSLSFAGLVFQSSGILPALISASPHRYCAASVQRQPWHRQSARPWPDIRPSRDDDQNGQTGSRYFVPLSQLPKGSRLSNRPSASGPWPAVCRTLPRAPRCSASSMDYGLRSAAHSAYQCPKIQPVPAFTSSANHNGD